ncbi:helix-turn-helix transcriptional regulator [Cryptosporangium phraense]|uniref:DNA-binding protein n=1 Tax=Cryptosporangium phraense TaxID=2593070 RepID=A0A545ASP6_9ACTN|nr:DNA-binding protein [Cryptosporangium phraense]TQS44360.1 DNA-binding protein [Cryptosporangium phraense]
MSITAQTRQRIGTAKVSELSGVPQATLRQWRRRNYGPDSHKLGGRHFYWLDEVTAFIEQAEQAS